MNVTTRTDGALGLNARITVEMTKVDHVCIGADLSMAAQDLAAYADMLAKDAGHDTIQSASARQLGLRLAVLRAMLKCEA